MLGDKWSTWWIYFPLISIFSGENCIWSPCFFLHYFSSDTSDENTSWITPTFLMVCWVELDCILHHRQQNQNVYAYFLMIHAFSSTIVFMLLSHFANKILLLNTVSFLFPQTFLLMKSNSFSFDPLYCRILARIFYGRARFSIKLHW